MEGHIEGMLLTGEGFGNPASKSISNCLQPFIVSCTILDTRVLYSQRTVLGGLCEILRVSWMVSLSMSRQNYTNTHNKMTMIV